MKGRIVPDLLVSSCSSFITVRMDRQHSRSALPRVTQPIDVCEREFLSIPSTLFSFEGEHFQIAGVTYAPWFRFFAVEHYDLGEWNGTTAYLAETTERLVLLVRNLGNREKESQGNKWRWDTEKNSQEAAIHVSVRGEKFLSLPRLGQTIPYTIHNTRVRRCLQEVFKRPVPIHVPCRQKVYDDGQMECA